MRRLVIWVFVLSLLGGCAYQKKTVSNLSSQVEAVSVEKKEKAFIKLVSQKNGVVIDIPNIFNVDVDYFMQDKEFVFYFSPYYPKVGLPTPEGIVQKIFYLPSNGTKAKSLHIVLKQPCQFLVSKNESKQNLHIMFVPRTENKPLELKRYSQQEINKIEFFKNKKGNLIVLFNTNQVLDVLPLASKAGQMELELRGINVSPEYEKIFVLDKFNTQIKKVFFQNKGKDLDLKLLTLSKVPFYVDIIQGKSALVFLTSDNFKLANLSKPKKTVNATKVEEETEENIPELNTILPGMKKHYTGKKISINLQDADVEHVIRLILSITNYNVIIDDDVQGKISLDLKNIPWDQALDLVLLQKNLGMVKQGNIIRIATQAKLRQEREAIRRAREEAKQARESMKQLAPLKREYIQINYSTVADIASKVKQFLSNRGKVTADERTNQLIVEDTEDNLKIINGVIKRLDRPEKQVLIEARIVYVTDEFTRSLGLKWGPLKYAPGQYTGNYIYKYYNDDTNTNYSKYDLSGQVNLPPSDNSPLSQLQGSVAFLSGKDLFTLDAELKLAETQNLAKTVSTPRIVTLNNQAAEITQGSKIAVQTESSSGGTTVEYKDAVLKLKVTPHITPDKKIILSLDISDDTPKGENGDIETKTVKTKLVVADGETIVLGGVRKITTNNNQNRVPGLHKIPILGWLFKDDYKSVSKQELLIFIRPKILENRF
ncbi:MAG: type IV pilus secretin PilQ [Desulfonauticus sp.]|nr:type IV pilus secretin PilQ [Desulfonauticus sp.]